MLVHFIRFLRHCQFVRVSLGRYLTEMFVGLIGHSVYETYYLHHFLKDFYKKRAMAMALASTGSPLGGIVYPVILNNLISSIGFGWAQRLCGFLSLFLLAIAAVSLRPSGMRRKGNFILLDAFRNPIYTPGGRDVHGHSRSLDALLLSCELWLGSWYVAQPRWLSVCTHQCRLLSWTYLGRAPCQSCWTIQCRYCRLLSFFPATLLLAYHFLFGGIGRLCGLVWCGQWCNHRPHDAAFCSYGRPSQQGKFIRAAQCSRII